MVNIVASVKRLVPLFALVGVVGLAACTPEQLNTLGINDPAAREALSALPDVAVGQADGSILEIDGTVTPAAEVAVRVGNQHQATPEPQVWETGLPPVPGSSDGPSSGTGLRGMPFAPAGLDNCAEMAFYRVQAGLPERFQALGWRESNCRNEDGVHTSCCWGYWQAHQGNWHGTSYAPLFRDHCQAQSYRDVNSDNPLEKQKQACVAKVMYDISGYRPWAL